MNKYLNYLIVIFILGCSFAYSQALTRKTLSKDALKVCSFYVAKKDFRKANHFLNFSLALDITNKEALLIQAKAKAVKLDLIVPFKDDAFVKRFTTVLNTLGSKQTDDDKKSLYYHLSVLINPDNDAALSHLMFHKNKGGDIDIGILLVNVFDYNPEFYDVFEIKSDEPDETQADHDKSGIGLNFIARDQIKASFTPKPYQKNEPSETFWISKKYPATHNYLCMFYESRKEANSLGEPGISDKNCTICGGENLRKWRPNYVLYNKTSELSQAIMLFAYGKSKKDKDVLYYIYWRGGELGRDAREVKPNDYLLYKIVHDYEAAEDLVPIKYGLDGKPLKKTEPDNKETVTDLDKTDPETVKKDPVKPNPDKTETDPKDPETVKTDPTKKDPTKKDPTKTDPGNIDIDVDPGNVDFDVD